MHCMVLCKLRSLVLPCLIPTPCGKKKHALGEKPLSTDMQRATTYGRQSCTHSHLLYRSCAYSGWGANLWDIVIQGCSRTALKGRRRSRALPAGGGVGQDQAKLSWHSHRLPVGHGQEPGQSQLIV